MNSDIFSSNNSECNYCETKQTKPYLYPTNGPKNFTYFHFNIRSLQKNFESLEQLLINHNIQPDVIGLTKIKMPRIRGVGIFIKDNVDFVLQNLKFKSLDCENLWLELKKQKYNNWSCV